MFSHPLALLIDTVQLCDNTDKGGGVCMLSEELCPDILSEFGQQKRESLVIIAGREKLC